MVTEPLSGEMRGLCHWVLGCSALVSGHMLLIKVFGSPLPFPQTELSLTQFLLKRPGCPSCPGPGLSHKPIEGPYASECLQGDHIKGSFCLTMSG